LLAGALVLLAAVVAVRIWPHAPLAAASRRRQLSGRPMARYCV
jgi:hypothetical protein